MTINRVITLVLLSLSTINLQLSTACAQGSAFTYQGRLMDNGTPANGLYEMSFVLYDAVTNGNAVGTPIAVTPVVVSNGPFTVTLDFGGAPFTGAGRWLEISVTVFGSDQPVTTLVPRQPLTPTPYALHAANAAGLMSFAGAPLDIKVNGERVLRLEVTGSGPNIIGGASVNGVGPDVVGATISGGGTSSPGFEATNHVEATYGTISGGGAHTIQARSRNSTVSGGWQNTIRADSGWSTIGGGESNTIEPHARYSTISGGGLNKAGGYGSVIAGGSLNTVETNAEHSSIGGGIRNAIHAFAEFATIAGGWQNTIEASAWATVGGGDGNTIRTDAHEATIAGGLGNLILDDSQASTIGGGGSNAIGDKTRYGTIAGGDSNQIQPESHYATISGGRGNNISLFSEFATVAGGNENTVCDTALAATIGGGYANEVAPGASYATISGGFANKAAGFTSFAAGHRALAKHDGAFVWADASFGEPHFASTTNNEFAVRATGGVRFVTAIDSSGSNIAGVTLAPGSGTWSSLSDRNAKENFKPVNARETLEKVAALPLASWNYKAQDESIRHLGPTAQDFHAAFGLGESDRTVAAVDADGVALAAIQGLNQKLTEELQAKDTRIAELGRRLAVLEQLIQRTIQKRN